MYLKSIELQGFKTFANKTALAFLPQTSNSHPLTAIVGPNGSGKSNLADAIRWAMGEQSLKLLRGKESTDIIFSGSSGKGRSGFAEVTLLFDNHDRVFPIDTEEVAVSRRLYRDGTSEYLVNAAPSRLQDIHLMLAEANVGQRSYSVVGQGLVDQVLTSSPEERKQFFDDATGVRPLQIKRHQAMLKLRHTYENLAEIETIIREIEPRLRLLRRQVKRLEERESVETHLRELQTNLYTHLLAALNREHDASKKTAEQLQGEIATRREHITRLEERVTLMEHTAKETGQTNTQASDIQQKLRALETKRRALRDEEFTAEKAIELAKVRAQSSWAPLPLPQIIEELDRITREHHETIRTLKTVQTLEELARLIPVIEGVHVSSEKLSKRLKRPAPEDVKPDPALLKTIIRIRTEREGIDVEIASAEQALAKSMSDTQAKQSEVFAVERELREAQRTLHPIEESEHGVRITLARLEERRENIMRECSHELKKEAVTVLAHKQQELPALSEAEEATMRSEIDKEKYKLDLIGGIDPEIVSEYKETDERSAHLEHQMKDLKSAMRDTESVIDELDERIGSQSERAFRAINTEFQRYFKILFGGGTCSLVQLTSEDLKDPAEHNETSAHQGDVSEEIAAVDPDALEELEKRVKARSDRVAGIDIQATPPGKKLKALNLLSGGERALTSIALLAAIMATNPSPFVVLDEVDAALDEANTLRFAAILEELATKTQYIVITHNRATMEKADALYGVTMNEDGVSQLLSVRLSDVANGNTARR